MIDTARLTGDQSKGGSLLDFAVQLAFPAFGFARELSAMGSDDPDVRAGTLTGTLMGYGNQPGLINQFGQAVNSLSNTAGGWFGGDSGGYAGYGGSPYTGGGLIESLGGEGNSLSDDMSSTGSWTSADEQSYADEVGVADY